ncbi:MAG: hypothetical protein HYZ53_04215 [Planctomycetes bacterium]|nr:hypothetical protein [Planctomycetota bacterium]
MARVARRKRDPLPDSLRARIDEIAERVRRRELGRPPAPPRGKRRASVPPHDPDAE